MRSPEKIFPFLILVLVAGYANGQKGGEDSLFNFREMARVRQVFARLPVQVDIHIQTTADPVTGPNDTVQADMHLYYGNRDFYLQADGLEEMANDSFIVMVNNPAKQILLYPNNAQLKKNMASSALAILPDSSLQYMTKAYGSSMMDEGDMRTIELKSRETIFRTGLPKETLTLRYRPSSYEGAEFIQVKYRLLPVDSVVYAGLASNKAYDGKLLTAAVGKGKMCFMIKRSTTVYTFKKIQYDIPNPPVRQQDRILKVQDGSFTPAKGFEEYILSKEF